MVINKFPNREVYEKIKEKGGLGADDVNVLEDYHPGLEWKGEYSSTAIYVKGDIVYYENMLYVMVSASVIGAIPGIDNDWIDFAKRSVTSSDVTNALGFTPGDLPEVLGNLGTAMTDAAEGAIPIADGANGWGVEKIIKTYTGDADLIGYIPNTVWVAAYMAAQKALLKLLPDSAAADVGKLLQVGADGNAAWGNRLPTALKNPAALTFAGAVTGTYDGSEALTITIPEGDSGTDLSLGVTGATVGQIAKISAVDENGKPTKWEPVDMPSGGGETRELINETCINGVIRDMTPEEIAEMEGANARYEAEEKHRPLTIGEVSEMLIKQQINTLAVDDQTALRMIAFYPAWESGKAYAAGYKLVSDGKLYKVLQAHTSQETWVPGAAGTESLYARIDEEHDAERW